MAKDPIDKILRIAEQGKSGSTLAETRRATQPASVPKPNQWGIFTMPPQPDPKPKTNMPSGATQSPKGDLGALRQRESHKAMRQIKRSGPDMTVAGKLPWSKPATAIDEKFGPGDKVCS